MDNCQSELIDERQEDSVCTSPHKHTIQLYLNKQHANQLHIKHIRNKVAFNEVINIGFYFCYEKQFIEIFFASTCFFELINRFTQQFNRIQFCLQKSTENALITSIQSEIDSVPGRRKQH